MRCRLNFAAERDRLERFRRIARVVCDLVGVPLVVAVCSVIDAAVIEKKCVRLSYHA